MGAMPEVLTLLLYAVAAIDLPAAVCCCSRSRPKVVVWWRWLVSDER
jgi:hypothetical protein